MESLADFAMRMANEDLKEDLKFYSIVSLSILGLLGSIIGFITIIIEALFN